MQPAKKLQSCLVERIAQINAEATAEIDKRADALKVSYPTQPWQSLRYELTRGENDCEAFLRLSRLD